MRRVSEADLGKGQMLRFKAKSADKGSMVSVVREQASREVRRRERESGQALVEFALILPLFLMIVVGIIQFGVALNYWLDMQRIANQGARWAVVNKFPGDDGKLCRRPECRVQQSEPPAVPRRQRVSGGLEPVRRHLLPGHDERSRRPRARSSSRFRSRSSPILGLGTIKLTADATMRLEQKPGRYAAGLRRYYVLTRTCALTCGASAA